MDDLRVDHVSYYDPNRHNEPPAALKRRREKRAEDQELEVDDIIAVSKEPEGEAGEEPVQDYYQPSSSPAEESE